MSTVGFSHESTRNESKEWYTPPTIFNALKLSFDLDVASPGAAVVPWIPAARHLTLNENGLMTPWIGRMWCNPPYGNDTALWLARFCSQNCTGVFLCFARTGTRWFHSFVPQVDGICFLKGRVKFICGDGKEHTSGCGADSMLLARGDDEVLAVENSGLGLCFRAMDIQKGKP